MSFSIPHIFNENLMPILFPNYYSHYQHVLTYKQSTSACVRSKCVCSHVLKASAYKGTVLARADN